MRSLKKHQYKTNELVLRCQHTEIHRWTPLDGRQRGLERGAGASGRFGHPKSSQVKGEHWGLHTLMTRLRAQGNEHQVWLLDYCTFSKMDFLQNAQESLLLWKICRWSDEPERPLASILVCLVTGSWKDSQQDCYIENTSSSRMEGDEGTRNQGDIKD